MSDERFLHEQLDVLADAGLRGSFLVRDLQTGREIGIDPDLILPIASLVKIPLAVATLTRIARGEIDGSTYLLVRSGRLSVPATIGLAKFRHDAHIAVDDLIYLSMAISDSAAADALFSLTPPTEVNGVLRELEIRGISVRHTLQQLTETPAEYLDRADTDMAHALAIDAGTGGHGHRIPQLDVSSASAGSARAFVDLMNALWNPSEIAPDVSGRVRSLMADNMLRQRLAPDFTSDASSWASKTGTLLNLRHEVGVVEHVDGGVFAVAALTESQIPAVNQPGAEAAMGQVARAMRDRLRER